MIRLPDPTRVGPALHEIREMLGISRRETARKIAKATGRTETAVNGQLWTWDVAGLPGRRGGHRPDLASLGPYLDALEFELALVPRADPAAPRSWPRLDEPPRDVRKVVSDTGTLWTRKGEGSHFWTTKGWEEGVTWDQVLRWGPVAEVTEET